MWYRLPSPRPVLLAAISAASARESPTKLLSESDLLSYKVICPSLRLPVEEMSLSLSSRSTPPIPTHCVFIQLSLCEEECMPVSNTGWSYILVL